MLDEIPVSGSDILRYLLTCRSKTSFVNVPANAVAPLLSTSPHRIIITLSGLPATRMTISDNPVELGDLKGLLVNFGNNPFVLAPWTVGNGVQKAWYVYSTSAISIGLIEVFSP